MSVEIVSVTAWAEAMPLGSCVLGMFGSRNYLNRHSVPTDEVELGDHRIVYFISSMPQVDGLDVG